MWQLPHVLQSRIIWRVEINPKPDPFAVNREYRWEIEAAAAKDPIWHWDELPGGKLRLNLLNSVKVDRATAEVDGRTAQQILEAWTSVLRLTRYAEEPNVGLDGVTFDFFAGGFFGTVWSPKAGLPADLVKLAQHLRTVAHAAPDERKPLLDKALLDAGKLKAAAENDRKRLARETAR